MYESILLFFFLSLFLLLFHNSFLYQANSHEHRPSPIPNSGRHSTAFNGWISKKRTRNYLRKRGAYDLMGGLERTLAGGSWGGGRALDVRYDEVYARRESRRADIYQSTISLLIVFFTSSLAIINSFPVVTSSFQYCYRSSRRKPLHWTGQLSRGSLPLVAN